MALPFLDTNVLLRHLMQDHPEHCPQATRLVASLERGDLRCQPSEVVVFETVYTLQGFYQQPRERIREGLVELLDLPGIVLATKRVMRRALNLYADERMSFPDAYHVALMERLNITQIVTFDRDFDGVPGIERVEPDQVTPDVR